MTRYRRVLVCLTRLSLFIGQISIEGSILTVTIISGIQCKTGSQAIDSNKAYHHNTVIPIFVRDLNMEA